MVLTLNSEEKIMPRETVLIIFEGRNFVGKVTNESNESNDFEVTDVFEAILMVGQEMQIIPIRLGNMRSVPSTAVVIVLDKTSPYYETHMQASSGLTLPTGPHPVGKQ